MSFFFLLKISEPQINVFSFRTLIKSLIREAPKKRISRAERIMTEGDYLYENPGIKRVRKPPKVNTFFFSQYVIFSF